MQAVYNQHIGDVLLLVTSGKPAQVQSYEKKGSIVRLYDEATQETVGWNFFEASQLGVQLGVGIFDLSDQDVTRLNQALATAGYVEQLKVHQHPAFLVGQIKSLEAIPDTHLNIAQVAISDTEQVQIVAGAPNARVGLKTIVAMPGAIMPSGAIIYDGSLRGVASSGMLCSPRELALPNAPQVRGIIELPESSQVGDSFDPIKHWH